jgi:mRNA degradation ribonuclease J1/J2
MTSPNGPKANAKKPSALRVIPLGGLHEIGKNTCVFEYGDDIMLVDAGLAFPSDGMHGVNVVLPDTSYLPITLKTLISRSSMARGLRCRCCRARWMKLA